MSREAADQPAAAASRSAMMIFFIWNSACPTRPATSGSAELNSSVNRVGTTCQETPNLSFSQPHWPSSPPSVSASQ